MAGIGHIRDLTYVVTLQDRKDLLGPLGRLFFWGLSAGVHVLFPVP
jgi:hypothetical protein